MKKRFVIIILLCVFTASVLANYERIMLMIPTDFSDTKMVYTDDGITRYYYNLLSNDAKIAYTNILNAIREHPDEIEIPELNDEDFHAMFCALSYDNPELLCMKKESQIIIRGAKAYFVPQYFESASACEAHRTALESEVRGILSRVTENMDVYDRELFFHDIVCESVSYVEEADAGYTAYDALVTGEAVCEGYSRAMQLLLNRVGISNYLVTGTGVDSDGTSEGHMWNVVTLYGKNYYLDVTWDDSDSEELSRYSHTYFNVTSADIQKNHLEIYPENNNCVSTEYNYFVRQGLFASHYNASTENLIVREIQEAVQRNDNTFELRFAESSAFDAAVSALIDDGRISELARRATRRSAFKYESVLYVLDEDLLTLQFAFC